MTGLFLDALQKYSENKSAFKFNVYLRICFNTSQRRLALYPGPVGRATDKSERHFLLIFTARRCIMLSHGVRLSYEAYRIETAHDHGAVPYCSPRTRYRSIPTESPPTAAPNTGGLGKTGDFRPASRSVSETVRDSDVVTTKRCVVQIFSMGRFLILSVSK